MNSFSQRKGLKPVKDFLQTDSVDIGLRNRLWNVLYLLYFSDAQYSLSDIRNEGLRSYLLKLWNLYWKLPVDSIPSIWPEAHQKIRKYFCQCNWNEVYDFIEFTAKNHPDEYSIKHFIQACNHVLAEEMSGYRFVEKVITQISSEEEKTAIDEAITITPPFHAVAEHLKCALDLLSNRKNPDFRNSIKESISAVEALCRIITGNPKATLGDGLKKLDTTVELHPAFKDALSKLYGYTSDENGIRHSLLEESNLTFDDAKFMLVSCSAFVNYIKGIASKGGIKL